MPVSLSRVGVWIRDRPPGGGRRYGSVAGPSIDVAAISALYAEGASWQQHPFRDPEPGYLARVFAEEESAECRFGAPIAGGDQAAVPWSAQTRLTDGGTEDLAGVSLLRFGTDGLVVEERDFWNQR
jgi:hypothetical protein